MGYENPRACENGSISAKALDTAVWKRVEDVLTEPDIIRDELERLRGADPTGQDLIRLDKALVEVTRQQQNQARALAQFDDASAAEPVVRELERLSDRKQQLQTERDEVLERRAGWASAQQQLADLDLWRQSVAAALNTLSYESRRQALLALNVKVTVYPRSENPRYSVTATLPFTTTESAPSIVSSTHRDT